MIKDDKYEQEQKEKEEYLRANDTKVIALQERHMAAIEELAQNQRRLFLTLNDVLNIATTFAAEFLAAYQERTKALSSAKTWKD